MAVGGSMQHRSPRTPRESVYRPYIDLLADDSPSTVPETQYAGIETFSFEELGAELGLSPIQAEEEGEDEAEERRTIWTVWENAALAKAWVGVVEDPYVGPNQYVDRLWHRISEAYRVCKLSGAKARTSEQCRKQWLRLRPKLSRFAAIYHNNMRMATSGMSEDDVRRRALAHYPDKELKFKEFDQWEAFLVVKDSQKFAVGVDSGWKRTKINSSGEYNQQQCRVRTSSPKPRKWPRYHEQTPPPSSPDGAKRKGTPSVP
ncbi:glutathione S-transferase T3-like [Salvia hispanica]|uniref:glutathione S-transferase T3-like n=1 Tax=Salvia hispanica TaxID=49212 RepID=UPI0020090978|nr:glutathione S-transferase T3-like [Salvia hispanica]